MTERFTGNFTQQEPIPEAGVAAALEVLRHGRLHRYNRVEGEISQAALLEEDFAAFTGATYALAVASGGYALGCALRAVGVGAGDKVLTNAFTLAPVPGAIASVGAEPILIEVTEELVLDLDDLRSKLDQASVLLLSHMRGHLCDMRKLMALCDAAGVTVIEDCAHTMGASWDGTVSGRFGAVGCFSTQTYKHINSGEGGLLITDSAEIAARMVLMSGSYMHYEQHGAAPEPDVFKGLSAEIPNISGRMDNLRAAILRPQLADLPQQAARWNGLYARLEAGLRDLPGLALIPRPPQERYVASSFQARLPEWSSEQIETVIARCRGRGVELKWFGVAQPTGYTSRHQHWGYVPAQELSRTDEILRTVIDMRLPLTFSEEDCAQIARILRDEIGRIRQTG